MKFALIGHPVKHSMSPDLYREILGSKIEYDLLDIEDPEKLPKLKDLAQVYDGINITTPYKGSYLSQVEIEDPEIKSLNAINAISFVGGKCLATNTDYLAVQLILKEYLEIYPNLHILLLGDGSMANLTKRILASYKITYIQLSRRFGNLHSLTDLTAYSDKKYQTLIINACSRSFRFEGKTDSDNAFWDFNYSYLPDNHVLPSMFKSYQDGRKLLSLQAKACADFWLRTNPKLKY